MNPKCYCDQLYDEYRIGPCSVCEAKEDARADREYFDALEKYERAREDEADLRDMETPGNFEEWMV